MNTDEPQWKAGKVYTQTTGCIVIPVFPGIAEPQFGKIG